MVSVDAKASTFTVVESETLSHVPFMMMFTDGGVAVVVAVVVVFVTGKTLCVCPM